MVAVMILLVLGAAAAMAAEPKRGGTLRVVYGNKISHLDFHTAPGYEMMWVAMNIGCGLVDITPDPKIAEFYLEYASEMDSVRRAAIAKELQEYMADKLYWNTVSGSPFYQVAQSWMKGYTFNAEFEVHYDTVWLDR
jgi:ABC-type transport system substrate-binding protein